MALSEVYNIDCKIGLKKYPDNYFDLLVADVAYGIKQGGDKNHTRTNKAKAKEYHSFNDDKSPDLDYFNEAIRVSKNQIFWGANHFISKIPFDSSGWIVWDKKNGNNDFADCELAYTSFPFATRKFEYRWAGMLQENMKSKENRIHPCQKPKALYKFCFEYAKLKQGAKILDTHLGSGNSRIVAQRMNFDFVGYEIDKIFFDAAEENYQKEINGIIKINQSVIRQSEFNFHCV
jgi:site-specific DNA-methyltransferase (adenine-specific)